MALLLYKKDKYLKQEESRQELGFGKQVGEAQRLVNRDGSFNVKRVGSSILDRINIYHELITCTWPQFGRRISFPPACV